MLLDFSWSSRADDKWIFYKTKTSPINLNATPTATASEPVKVDPVEPKTVEVEEVPSPVQLVDLKPVPELRPRSPRLAKQPLIGPPLPPPEKTVSSKEIVLDYAEIEFPQE